MENIRTVRQVRSKTGQAARYRRNSAKPVKKRTSPNGGNGFLNHQFRPFWLFDGNKERAESEFFRSLELLCTNYDLQLPDVQGLAFPMNIYRSWQITSERITAIDKKLDCIILKDDAHEATLAIIRQFDTGRNLYYIPVKPLWVWANCAEQQAVTEVVLAIFAYLYQVVQIPLFTEQDSFLGGQYSYCEDMINDEMCDSDEDERLYKEEQLNELYTLQNAGLHLRRMMLDKQRLEQMEDTVLNYANAEIRDNDLAILAIEFVQLYKAYPNRTCYDGIRPDLFYPEIEERIGADEYISFYWSGYDTLIDTVMDIINCEFQEKGVTDEPIDVTLFDDTVSPDKESFGFESRFFPLIIRLTEFLDDYDNGK